MAPEPVQFLLSGAGHLDGTELREDACLSGVAAGIETAVGAFVGLL